MEPRLASGEINLASSSPASPASASSAVQDRPGFGTLAESMSGFAHVTGQPDGPRLPPFGLADGIAALASAVAILTALRARDAGGSGQVIDLAIIEPIFTVLGPQPTVYDQLGVIQQRSGNRSVNNAPRNTYQTEGRPLGRRLHQRPEHRRARDAPGRTPGTSMSRGLRRAQSGASADELDEAVGLDLRSHPGGSRRGLRGGGGGRRPIYDIEGIMQDPQYEALNSIITVDDPELGPTKMQNVLFRLSETRRGQMVRLHPGSAQRRGLRRTRHRQARTG